MLCFGRFFGDPVDLKKIYESEVNWLEVNAKMFGVLQTEAVSPGEEHSNKSLWFVGLFVFDIFVKEQF